MTAVLLIHIDEKPGRQKLTGRMKWIMRKSDS